MKLTDENQDTAVETKRVVSAQDPSLPFSPVTLALATGPEAEGAIAALANELATLLERGSKEEAHRRAQPHIAEESSRPALADFYLREGTGRRGARLLLRWLRADEGEHRLFARHALGALECWAHFRLLRHGRALKIARAEIGELTAGGADERSADTKGRARVWGQTLEAIRTSALRRGNLRLALNFHELAEGLERAHPGSPPEPKRARAAMTAVAFLLDLHAEHGLPATVTRYLARTLGHREGDSPAAYAEVATDLGVRPEHLDGALEIAARFGFEAQVAARLGTLREKLFQGNWQARRTVQRGLLVVLWLVVVGVVMLGFTLLVHFVTR